MGFSRLVICPAGFGHAPAVDNPLGALPGGAMDEAIELRRPRPDEAGAIRELTREAYAKWVPHIGREPQPMWADYEEAVKHHRFDLLEIDGVLAALIETVDEGEQLLIENVAVRPGYQGRGLGSKLMAHAEEIARSLGRRRVRLYTNKAMAENIQLYSRLGYRVDGEAEGPPGLFRVYMSKALEDPHQ
jgi:ribosomal protein S18 acetylase RimI-like enzyme